MRRRDFLELALAGSAWSAMAAAAGKTGRARHASLGRVVVVGAGYGGATAAKYVRILSGGRIEVILVDQNADFISCPVSNRVLAGQKTLEQLTFGYDLLQQHHGVKFMRGSVTAIDASKSHIVMAGKKLSYDRLIVAPGIDFIFDAAPKLAGAQQQIPHAWKAGPQTRVLHQQLLAMPNGGVFTIVVPPQPYRCPPAPYERACQVAFYLKTHKPRSKVMVLDANPVITSKRALFERAWRDLYPGMIEYVPGSELQQVDVATKTVKTAFDTVKSDVLNIIPPQRAGRIAQDCGLANVERRWCEVDFISYASTVLPHERLYSVQEQHPFPFLREILLFLSLAGILIPLLQRLRINQVLGFLAAGALFGPFGLGRMAHDVGWLGWLTFPNNENVGLLAELGVLFLMFMIGLELSAARLWAMRRWVFGAGSAQVALCALLLGGAVWLLLDQSMEASLVLGLVLSLSSTAVVMQLLSERQTTGTPLGQAAFAVLMLQDLAVVPILILIGALGGHAAGDGGQLNTQLNIPMLALLAMGKAALAIALIYLVGGRVVHPLFRAFARHRQPDVFMALILLSTFGIAALSAIAGLSMALGALIAGLLLAETEFKHEVELMVEPFKGLLMGLFFMTVGMGMDPLQIVHAPLWLACAVVLLIVLKAVVIAPVLRLGGLPWGRAVEGALLLGQGGEFAFIVIGYAVSARLLDPGLGGRVMLAVGLSLFLTPMLARIGRTIGERTEGEAREREARHADADLEAARGRVIIAGFGRVGQQLAKLLASQGIPYVAFENDAKLVSKLHAQGVPVYFGNAARPELLRRVHAIDAPAIVLTMDHPSSALQAVRGIRREFPHMRLFARSRDEKHARALKLAGASVVVPETLEASLQLSSFVLQAMGLDERVVDVIIDRERDQFAQALTAPDGSQ
jgi:CPA2 family monovalent cation:H+ antiporter-2